VTPRRLPHVELERLPTLRAVVRATRAVLAALAAFAAVTALPPSASAQVAGMPPEMARAGVTEHLDGQLPLDATFRDHTGKTVKLRDLFDGKQPVVLTFAYHTCPVVCSMILNQEAQGLRGVDWTLGKDYRAVTISIDPNETLEKTAQKRLSILREYTRAGTGDDAGWSFLVGDQKTIDAVSQAAGFEAQYDPDQKQWAHPSLVMVVKPDGRMARYLYGIEFPPNDLRLGLLEAAEYRTITSVEKLILYCYHYDPKGGKYVLVARRVMQVGGGLVALVLFGFLGAFWAAEFKRARKAKADASSEKTPALLKQSKSTAPAA
jgi:protein SCO1/2